MTRAQLTEKIHAQKNYLCVGLDTDRTKLPVHLRSHPDALFEFNRRIIDATKDHCIAYKVNTAFYEAEGSKGWEVLERTAGYLPRTHFRIADAKRGDIGNTSAQYAKAFFETMDFDALTVAPYMGADSLRPFFEHRDKWTIVLGLTSNPGAADFEMQRVVEETDTLNEGMHLHHQNTSFLYETVIRKTAGWGSPGQLMFVVGATRPEELARIRALAPDHFFLVPGIGAQGGDLRQLSKAGLTADGGLLVNASRAVIYASDGEDFAEAATAAAKGYANEMKILLNNERGTRN